jgi:hypothetical protein
VPGDLSSHHPQHPHCISTRRSCRLMRNKPWYTPVVSTTRKKSNVISKTSTGQPQPTHSYPVSKATKQGERAGAAVYCVCLLVFSILAFPLFLSSLSFKPRLHTSGESIISAASYPRRRLSRSYLSRLFYLSCFSLISLACFLCTAPVAILALFRPCLIHLHMNMSLTRAVKGVASSTPRGTPFSLRLRSLVN